MKFQYTINLAVCLALLFSCTTETPRVLTDDEIQLIDSLELEISNIQSAIDDEIRHSALYEGGLIKSLSDARIITLRLSQDLLQKRIYEIRSFSAFIDSVPSFTPDSSIIMDIDEKINLATKEYEDALRESEKYSGGLLQVLALSTAATSKQTIAMLKLQRIGAKYGIFVPEIESGILSPSHSTHGSATTRPELGGIDSKPKPKLEILSIDGKVTETNQVWWKYAWKVEIENLTDISTVVDVTIEFLDGDGFIIDEDDTRNTMISGNSKKTVTGYALINLPGAKNVEQFQARVKRSY